MKKLAKKLAPSTESQYNIDNEYIFYFVWDDWFSRNHVYHPTMRENLRDARGGLTRRVLYFFGQQNFDAFFNVYRR